MTKNSKRFNTEEIVNYYDLTKVHYRRAWDLSVSRAMHYGYKHESKESFRQSLQNMNSALATFAPVNKKDKVLDAGCGIGGSSIFLREAYDCEVTGISLSEDQIQDANRYVQDHGIDQVHFEIGDYTQLQYDDASFDVVWALESLVHCEEKALFFDEVYRVLKPGGRLILGEYTRNSKQFTSRNEKLLRSWLNAWAIKDIELEETYFNLGKTSGFKHIKTKNINANIADSSWRMFYGSWFLFILSNGYKLFNPKVSRFADQHYKGLYYQYLGFRKNLWTYHLIRMEK